MESADGLVQAQKTDWLPELKPFLHKTEHFGIMLGNPIVHELFPIPGYCNVRYRIMQDQCRDAWREGKWETWVWLHERPYRTQSLWNLIQGGKLGLEEAQTGLLASSVWRDCENIPQTKYMWWDLFHTMDGDLWMEDEDRNILAELPEEFTVWRGVCEDLGYSWTLSEKTAEFFANRPLNEATGEVISRTVHKDEVFAYLGGRSEEEILIVDD